MSSGDVLEAGGLGQFCPMAWADGSMANGVPARNAADFSIKPRNEAELITAALTTTEGNIRQAVLLLGISRRTLYRKLEQFGLDCNAMRRRNGIHTAKA